MAEFQCGHCGHDQLIRHHKLNLPFLDLLDLATLPNERMTALQWAKLTAAQHLPRTVIVSPDSPTTGSEYGAFDHIDMAVRNKKAELVHSA